MNLPVSLKTIANVLGIVLLIALVAPFVVYAVPGVVGADHSFVVLTASMTPAIAPGDVVIVAERDPATIVEGDVITFVRGDNEVPVTHRVIDVVDGPGGVAFETQGDANGAPDASLVPGANVIGAVAITIPYIGYVIQFVDSPVGFIALVVVPFGLLALSEVWSLYRARSATDAADDDDVTDDEPASEAGDATASSGGGAEVASGTAAAAAGSDGIVVTDRTLQGALGVLLVFAPYAAYVAYTLRTGLSVAVATATAITMLAAVGLLLAGRRSADTAVDASASRSDDDPTPEDGAPVTTTGATVEEPAFEEPTIEPAPDGGVSEGDEQVESNERIENDDGRIEERP